MAKTRVHELAKEFGMTSKEMLARLEDMKIPAKAAASALEDAYVDKIRKELAPLAEQRADVIKEEAEAEAKVAQEQAKAEAEKAEIERKAAEARREIERKEEEVRRAAADKKRAEEQALRDKEEAERKAAEEAARVKDTAPKSQTSFTSLLDQIAAQEAVLKETKAAEAKKRAERAAEKKANRNKADQSKTPADKTSSAAANKKNKKRGGKSAGKPVPAAPVDLSREKVMADARAAIVAAGKSSEGSRKMRKEKREQEAEERRLEERVEEAKVQGIDVEDLDDIKVSEGVTVAELAELLDTPANDIIKRLFLLGTPLTMTQTMSNELIELIAEDMGRKVRFATPEEENTFVFYDEPEDLKPRPPVVTVMGHVDHGKTSLLDAIRNTGVALGEAGGITQHIGAYEVEINGSPITFVDTPGHEAFTAMRARGAKVTDIVVLVVAADDGVMPQTVEAVNHSKAAGVPIIVAINKMDKPGANPDRIRSELSERGVVAEDWGGDTMFVEVSAKKGLGIDELLESIILQADVLELKANPDTLASGYVLEAKLDRGRGPVATLLVNRGTLHVGDAVVAGTAFGRVRALVSQAGSKLKAVLPSEPVEVLGLGSVPAAGDEFRVFEDERDARKLAEERALKQRLAAQDKKHHVTLENLFATLDAAEKKELNIIVKADVQGSIEALADALSKIDQSEVSINIIHSAVGGITETDVTLASASDAIIIGFGVRPQQTARAAAEREKVQIRSYRVIYQAIDDINAARVGMLNPDIVEQDTGSAEVRELFRVPKAGIVAGSMVLEGEISRDDQVRVVRDGTIVHEGTLDSLRRFKDDVKTVKAGYECGLSFDRYQDLKVGDIIEGFRMVEVARKE